MVDGQVFLLLVILEYLKIKQLEATKEQQELINNAKELLDPNQYILFRKQLSSENAQRIKANRFYNYIVSIAICRNKNLFKTLTKKYGEVYARVTLYTCKNMVSASNEFDIKDYEL